MNFTLRHRFATVFALFLGMTGAVLAAAPSKINFQGRLTDSNGNPLTGTYSITFRICDSLSGGSCSVGWAGETQSVTVENGLFSALLGSVTPISESAFPGADRWLEVEVGGNVMSPRQQLVSVPYAFSVASVAQNTVGTFQIIDSTITDADVSPSAAIGWSKISKTGSSLADLATRSAADLNSGTLDSARIDTSSVTKQGNTFNGSNQLVRLDGAARLPAIDGSLLTGISASAIGADSVGTAQIMNSTVTLVDLNTGDVDTRYLTTGTAQTITGVKTISADWVNTANPWADNEVADNLTISAGGSVAAAAVQAGSLGGGVIASSVAVNSVTSDSIVSLAASKLTGSVDNARLDNSSVTLQGNAFNAADKLVRLDSSARLPAVDGSRLTNLPNTLTADSVGTTHLINSTVTLADLNTGDIDTRYVTTGTAQTFTGVKTISADWVNTANPWADNEVADNLTIGAAGSVAAAALQAGSLGGGVIASSVAVNSVTSDSIVSLAAAKLTGTLDNARLDNSSVTLQGNAFNAADKLVRLDSSARLPAVDGSLLTGINATNVATDSVGTAQIINSTVTLVDLNTGDVDMRYLTTGTVQTITGVKTINADWVNTANPWADNEVADNLTISAGGSVAAAAVQAGSLGGGVIASSVAVNSVTNDSIVSLAASKLTGSVDNARLDNSSVTLQGNTFNAASKLVRLDSSTRLPAVDGSQLTNVIATSVGSNTVGTTQIINSTVALVDLNTGDVDTRYLTTGTAQTITGVKTIGADWVNTANPWADNEVADNLTIGAGGSVAAAAVQAGSLGGGVIASSVAVSTVYGDAIRADTIDGTHLSDMISLDAALSFSAGAAGRHFVINEDGVDADFRVEAVGQPNMFFVDGGASSIGVGDAAPPADSLTLGALGTATLVSQGFNSRTLNFRGSGWDTLSAVTIEMPIQTVVGSASNYGLVLNKTPAATGQKGLLSLGSGGFTGGGSHFSGSASGTLLAGNAVAGFAGSLADLQIGGSSRFRVDANGNVTIAGGLSESGNKTVGGNLTVSGNTSLGNTSTNTLTLNGRSVDVPNGLSIDGGTLFIDAPGNRVGISTGVPQAKLDVQGGIIAQSSITAQGGFFGSGANLTSLSPANLSAGSLPGNVIASSIAVNAVENASIVSMSAAKLTGTVPSGALSGTYSNALTFGSAAGGPITVSTHAVISGSQFRLGNFGALPGAGAVGAGALVYNTGDSTVYVSNGGSWVPLAAGGASPWAEASGDVTLVTPSNEVGIGVTPSAKLHVGGTIKSDFGIDAATGVFATSLKVGGSDVLTAVSSDAGQFSGTGASGSPLTLVSSSVTLQGNTFNAANRLVRLDASARLPAVDGSLLTNISATNVAADSVGTTQILNSTVALVDLNTGDVDTRYLTTGTVQTVTGAKTFSAAPAFTASTPFSVTNNAVVANLNADLLDGQGGSFYQNPANLTAGNLPGNVIASSIAVNAVENASILSMAAAKLTGTIDNARLDNSSVTLQGNSTNAANALVKLDSSARLPAVDGSQLTSVIASTISCTDCVALGAETTGSYVATVSGDAVIGVTGSGTESAGVSLAVTADSVGADQLADAINLDASLTFNSVANNRDFVINGDGLDSDFRVASDARSHMLYVDGTSDRVGISSSAPAAVLGVQGDILATSNITSQGTFTGNGAGLTNVSATGLDCTNCAELGRETSGIYVASATAGAGIQVTFSGTEGSTMTITNIGDTNASDDITNATPAGGDLAGTYPNPTLAAGSVAGGNLGDIADNTVTADDLAADAVGLGPDTYGNFVASATAGAGIQVTFTGAEGSTMTITNTGDVNPSDDITTASSAGGDLTGTYPNPTLAAGAVTGGSGGDIADDTVTADDLADTLTLDATLTINSTASGFGVVINEDGQSADFRVESDGQAHMLFVNGASNRVGISSSAPSAVLGVQGDIVATSNITSQGTFSGNGSGLTNLSPSAINSGTLGAGVIASSIAVNSVHAAAFQSDTVGTAQIINSTVALADLNTPDVDTRYLTTGTAQTVTGNKTFSAAPSFTFAGAPFSVSNNAVVTNLNADLLDGQTGSYYQNPANLSAGSLPGTVIASSIAVNAVENVSIVSMNASKLTGTVPSAALSGTYSNAMTFGSAAGGPITFSTNAVVSAAQLRLGNFGTLPGAGTVGAGALVYNTGDSTIYVSNGSSWNPLASGGASPWTTSSGEVTLVTPTNKVGVGVTPAEKLHVGGTIKADNGITASTGVFVTSLTVGGSDVLTAVSNDTAQFNGTGASGNPLSLEPSSVTLQGNTFNGANQLVRLDSNGDLDAGITASSVAVNSVHQAAIRADAVDGTELADTITLDANLILAGGATNRVGISSAAPAALLGVQGGIIAQSSITAQGGFYGDGSNLTGINSAGLTCTNCVQTGEIEDGQVQSSDIAASVAGNGLTGGGGSALAVGAGTGITVNADDVQITNDGVGADQLADTITLDATLALNSGSAGRHFVFNADAQNSDFRVASVNQANMLFVDASADRVGISSALPAATLGVQGNILATSNITSQGIFNGNGSGLTDLNASSLTSGTVPDSLLNTSSVTKQGNTFNGANQLVRLDSSTRLPAVDGSQLTSLNASSLGTGTVPDSLLNTSSVTKQGNTFNGGGQLVKLDAASKMTANYGAGNVTGTVLPSGTLIITTATCPSGFNEFTGAGGFYLVGAPAGGTVGGTVGAAMTNLNDATHSHSITRTTGNNFSTLGAATAVTSVTTPTGTESRSNIAPYYQVRLCSVP